MPALKLHPWKHYLSGRYRGRDQWIPSPILETGWGKEHRAVFLPGRLTADSQRREVREAEELWEHLRVTIPLGPDAAPPPPNPSLFRTRPQAGVGSGSAAYVEVHPSNACLACQPARQRETGSLVLPPNFASADFIRMRPLILLAALLWLRGFLAEVRWARGGAEWVGLFSGACLGFPPALWAPQLVLVMEEGNYSLPSQASTEAGRTDCFSLPGCRLLPAG